MRTTTSARLWATLTHFSALCLYIGIPLGNVLGPLAVWFANRNRWPENDETAREAVNFQLTATLAFAGAWIVGAILSWPTGGLLWPVGAVLAGLVLVAHATFTIRGIVAVDRGGWHSYPYTLRIWR